MKRLLIVFLFVCQTVLAQDAPPAQTPPGDPSQQEKLSLQQALNLALKNNLGIQVEQYNPEIQDAEVALQKARFEPLFTAQVLTTDATQPTGSILVGEQSVSNENFDYNFRLDQVLWTGTTYNVTFNNSRIRTTQSFTSVNPRYDSSLFGTITQPLMRNFGVDITQAPVRIAQKNAQIADEELRRRMMDVALQTEQSYWNLVFAIRELDVVKQSLTSAQDLYESNKKQVEVGTMAPLEIVVAEAEVAQREQQIIAIETLIQNTEDQLKTLILPPDDPTTWDVTFAPTDEPDIKPMDMSEDEAVKMALAQSPDLKSLTATLESRRLSTMLAHNDLKPQLDFQASIGYAGLGGSRILLDDSVFPPIPIGTLPGGYNDALTSLFDNRTWSVGFVFGLPIGNGTARANYVKADLSEKQAKTALDDSEQQLTLNVRTTLRNMQSDLKRLEAAKASRILQEKKLDAERKKLKVGLSTNHLVLEFQDDLAIAQSAELRARVDYNKDHAQLERYLGTILP